MIAFHNPNLSVGVFYFLYSSWGSPISKGKIILVLGGARSGKSAYALSSADKKKGEKFFFATAEARDDEMQDRVADHQSKRPSHWKTVETPLDLIGPLRKENRPGSILIVDCLTLWLSNLVDKRKNDLFILNQIDRFSETLSEFLGKAWLVSNEVGQGVVPATPLGRRFRDLSGLMNQRLVRTANEVYWVTAGLTQRLK